ncbi:hypothetical protein BJV82DRAFT_584613 [Fennellomyces sp. T-0311]|nr:hypothetical protein BJV82DRAFT_584613 [Fennellomyces sp. T-0311]
MLDQIDTALRMAMRRNTHFGGIPVVFFGDFAQLLPFPTITDEVAEIALKAVALRDLTVLHVYHPCQQTDAELFDVLSKIRLNSCGDELVGRLLSRCLKASIPDDDDSVVIIAYRDGANAFNQERFDRLPGEIHSYPSRDQLAGMGSIGHEALLDSGGQSWGEGYVAP